MLNIPFALPEWGQFPPIIEHPVPFTVRRTSAEGGADAAVSGGLLCTIDPSNGGVFRIYDVAGENADEPRLLSELTGLGNCRQLALSGTLAAVTARAFGVWLIGFADPEHPVLYCHYDSVELATGVTFYDRYLIIGCRNFGVEVVDVSNPFAPRHVSNIRAGEVQSVFVSDGLLYTGAWGEHQVNILDLADLYHPKLLSSIPLTGRGDGVYVKDHILYAAFGHHRKGTDPRNLNAPGYGEANGFEIFDVSDPTAPVRLSATLLPHRYYYCGYDMWDVTLSGHYAVLNHTFNGVYLYDVTDLSAPRLVGHIPVPTEKPYAGFMAMLDDEFSVKRVTPKLCFDPQKQMYAPVSGIALANGRLYIAPLFEKLLAVRSDELFHAEEDEPPRRLLSDFYDRHPGEEDLLVRRTDGQTHAAIFHDGLVWCAAGNGGIGLFTPDTLECVGRIPAPGIVCDLREAGGLLFAACGTAGLLILRPLGTGASFVGRFAPAGYTIAQVVPSADGKRAVVHADDMRILILDVSDPAAPVILRTEMLACGLLYHRMLSYTCAAGRYAGCYWNSNDTIWYDLAEKDASPLPSRQRRISAINGVTGLPDEMRSLVVHGNGYSLVDITADADYDELPTVRVPGLSLSGKPYLFEQTVCGRLLVLCNRMNGTVVLLDVNDFDAPRLLTSRKFEGHPDIPCTDGANVFVPLGHEGIVKLPIAGNRN